MFTSSTLSLACALYFQVVRGWSPLTAGLALLPGPLSAAFAVPVVPLLIPRLGRARTVALGLLLMAVSTGSLAAVTQHTGYWRLLPILVLNGVGLILTFAVTSDTILASVPRKRTGGAASISETGLELGGALGIAVLGSVLTALYRSDLHLPSRLTGGQRSAAHESVTGGVETGGRLAGATGQQVADAARQAFTDSMHTTMLVAAAIMLLGAVAALRTLRDVPAVLDPRAEEAAVPAV
jgi:DHA2 family multidrug resistance protein-like MFS transporter